jgi:hypothetical protein
MNDVEIPTIPDGLTLATELPIKDLHGHLVLLAEYNNGTKIFVSKIHLSEQEVRDNLAADLDRIMIRVLIGRLANTVQVKELDQLYRELRSWVQPNNYWLGGSK